MEKDAYVEVVLSRSLEWSTAVRSEQYVREWFGDFVDGLAFRMDDSYAWHVACRNSPEGLRRARVRCVELLHLQVERELFELRDMVKEREEHLERIVAVHGEEVREGLRADA